MRILHTADWHLGDRLGRMDRTLDLRKAVERVAEYCRSEKADVLLVAGDLFSELAGPDGLRQAIHHLQEVFREFLCKGGTVVTLTGNHDKETFCQTLQHAMSLAAPLSGRMGELAQPGRFYLATEPTLLRLPDRDGSTEVQFLLMPYPTPARYLHDETTQRYQGLDERNRHLLAAFTGTMHEILANEHFRQDLPAVLGAHLGVRGAQLPTLFRLSEQEDVVLHEDDLPDVFAYVALGHIHRAQCLRGMEHIRYSGSIEKMDLGEADDSKGVVIFEVGAKGRQGEVVELPLESTPIYEVQIHNPRTDLPSLAERYPSHEEALVRIECTYTAGVDNREDVLRELEHIFPRWYDREIVEKNALQASLTGENAPHARSFEETVRDYLETELANHPDPVREGVLARVEKLMEMLSSGA